MFVLDLLFVLGVTLLLLRRWIVWLLDDCLVGGLFWCIWFVVGVDLLLIYYLVSVDVVDFDCLVWFD